MVVHQLATYICDHNLNVDCDCFAAFNAQRIILDICGVNWTVVELQAAQLILAVQTECIKE